MLESLRENILTDVDSDDLRVIIISGLSFRYVYCAFFVCMREDTGLTSYIYFHFFPARGPVFSSGHDLKELTSAQGRDYHTKVFHTCSEVSLLLSFHLSVLILLNIFIFDLTEYSVCQWKTI